MMAVGFVLGLCLGTLGGWWARSVLQHERDATDISRIMDCIAALQRLKSQPGFRIVGHRACIVTQLSEN